MNIYDISEQAGVSIATVSRVINGSGNVSENTKRKVLRIIDETGYTPNVFARGLGVNSVKTIGVICTDINTYYNAAILSSLQKELNKKGYNLIIRNYDKDVAQQAGSIRLLADKRIDALVLIGSEYIDKKSDLYSEIMNLQLPVVIINGQSENENIYSIVLDDEAVTRNITVALIKKGYNSLLFLYNETSFCNMKKLDGFRNAHFIHNLELPQERIRMIMEPGKELTAVLDSFFSTDNSVNGIVTTDDLLAAWVLKYAHFKNIAVPDDLCITGYNNSPLSRCTYPEITTVDSKCESLCVAAVNTLIGLLKGEDVPVRQVISAEFIRRDTTNI